MVEAAVVETAEGPGRPAPVSRIRGWTVGWVAGVAQALGAALLLISEFVRTDVAAFGEKVPPGTRLPQYASDFPHVRDWLGDRAWYRVIEDVGDALTLSEPRAALWAAVCAALVVRFNRDGPPRVQCVLSLLGAVYCALLAVVGIPYLALAGFALPFALVLGGVVLGAVTRR
ncbi:hypothetical protein [Streptomyces boncukensis]|uniref:Uncharacterized protein n=1 Tax=Streptomyces boncukensis TaxID=2711219 RepID=A0A6G4WZK0_9ACTN|nr:hypothetical protein [Streptomyces boncukensis]NGO70665.1 hypothetical protein [Streptomyces boncukensis]